MEKLQGAVPLSSAGQMAPQKGGPEDPEIWKRKSGGLRLKNVGETQLQRQP